MITTESFYKNLPRKRMASGVVLFNSKNEILMLKPHYRDTWSLPGGIIDKDESPHEACVREVKEEIGLDISGLRLLCVQYVDSNYDSEPYKDENLQFVFLAENFDKKQVSLIKLQVGEIEDSKFMSFEEARQMVNSKLKERLLWSEKAVEENTAFYFESGT